MDKFTDKDMNDYGLEVGRNTELDDQLFKFVTNGIEERNPVVLNALFFSDYNNIILPELQGNQFTTEFKSVSRQFVMDPVASMDQQMESDSQLYRNHVYVGGRNNSSMPFWDHNISYIDDIAMEINLSNNFQTYNNSQVAPLCIENMESDRGLILNSDLGEGIHGLNVASGSGNRLVANGMQIGNIVHDSKMETNLLNYRTIADNIEGHSGSRQDISPTNVLYGPSDSDVLYYDFESNNHATNCMKFDDTRYKRIYHAVPNIENYDQENQLFGNLSENRLDCVMAKYDPQHSVNLYKIPYIESIHSFQGNTCTLNNKEAMENVPNIRKTEQFIGMESTGQNLASNIGISQNEDVSRTYFYFGVSEKNRILSTDDTFELTCSSDTHEDNIVSKFCEEKFKSTSPLELFSVTHRNDGMTLYCVICKNDFDKHEIRYKGEHLYKCCVCIRIANSKHNLQKHNIKHLSNDLCNICAEVICYLDLHGTEQTCEVCGETFQCKPLLETHLLIHDEHFSTFCRVCMKEMNKHILQHPNLTLYKCCQCSYFGHLSLIQRHLYVHTGLSVFKCDNCGNRFTQKDTLDRHLKSHWRS